MVMPTLCVSKRSLVLLAKHKVLSVGAHLYHWYLYLGYIVTYPAHNSEFTYVYEE